MGLARIGLLDNVPHTSNLKEYIAATGYNGAAFYSSKPSVKLGQIITASAVSALGFSRDVFAVLDVCSEATLVPGTSCPKRAMESNFLRL